MEAIIYSPFEASHWRLKSPFQVLRNGSVEIAPRIEVRLDLVAQARESNPEAEVGHIMLGTWRPEMRELVKSTDPFRAILSSSPRASRIFHYEKIRFADLPLARMTDRLRGMLSKIFDRV